MNKSLYNITNEYQYTINQLEEGECTPELEKALEISQQELNQKSIAYLEVIKNREAFVSNIDEEIKRLQGLKKSTNNLVDRLKDNLLNAVLTFGEFTVGTVTFRTRKSKRLEIIDESQIPNKFKILKQTMSTDKDAVKKAIEDGEEVDGATIIENQNLMIK